MNNIIHFIKNVKVFVILEEVYFPYHNGLVYSSTLFSIDNTIQTPNVQATAQFHCVAHIVYFFCFFHKDNIHYGKKSQGKNKWCFGRELNPQSLRHPILSRMCMPVPPPKHINFILIIYIKVGKKSSENF